VIPILVLIGLMVLLAQLNLDLARPFTAPRLVSDARGGFLFYGGGTRDPGFFFREVQETEAKAVLAKRRYVPGVLAGAALLPEHLVTLYAGERKDDPWFYSLTKRETLERTWSGILTEPELGLVFPRHVATVNSQVYAFGSDASGAIRVARLEIEPLAEQVRPEPLEASVPEGVKVKDVPADSKERIPPALAFASAQHQGKLYLFWRVSTEKGQNRLPPGELRWTTFDGKGFSDFQRFQTDLQSFAPVTGLDGVLRLYGVKHGARDSEIMTFELVKDAFRQGAPVPYKREGLTGGAGVSSLAAGRTPKRVFIFAQIGAAIRFVKDEGQGFGDWQDVARRPAEQTAIVYGWIVALFGLAVLLVIKGLQLLRMRGGPPSGPTQTLEEFVADASEREARAPAGDVPPTPDQIAAMARERVERATAAEREGSEPAPLSPLEADLASLPERMLAFGLDAVVIFLILRALGQVVPWLEVPSEGFEPARQLTFAAWATGLVLVYFTVFEGFLGRTPGKRVLGLEVQDVTGGRASFSSIFYRNAFRIELLIPPFYIVPVLSLVLMLTTRYSQRPGDLLAHTTVRRTRPSPAPAPEGSGEPVQE
jgi:uncharacterized RDD family membrane protein YckC